MAFAPDVSLQPVGQLDALTRFTALLDRAEPRVRRRFLEALQRARNIDALDDLEEIGNLIATGRIDEALAIFDEVGPSLATSLENVYQSFGLSAAVVLRSQIDTAFDFSTLNARAVRDLTESRQTIIRELSREQRFATLEMLSDSFERGLTPVQQARRLRSSIGLTQQQARIVQNYRRSLETGSVDALTRELRDRRFDPTVRRALLSQGEDRIPLTAAQIDRMVERYSERWVGFRARTIARTETVAAAHAGDQELWSQAIEEGVVDAENVVSVWHTAADERVRSSHRAMNFQERPFGETFLSGNGNALRFPGDPNAPASDVVNCRCVVAREVAQDARTRPE